MKKILAGVICCFLLAGCGGTKASSGEDASAASASAGELSASSAAETSAASGTDGEFTQQEFHGIQYLARPDWTIEVSENGDLCHIYTPNDDIFYVIGFVTKDTIVNNSTDEGIYGSLEVFLGKEDQDVERLKFENGTHYITYFSDFETDHAYNSIFYTREGLFAFGLQLVGDIDEAEEKTYEEDYRMMLDTMHFEVPEYQTINNP